MFAAGYLLTWALAGLARLRGRGAGGAWRATCSTGTAPAAGSPAATLLVAAAYELTPLKDFCLGKCRSPLGFCSAPGAAAAGRSRMGARNGAWCVGCCWALMASLFALGVMSLAWMAFVAALIAAEKLLPRRRVATYGTAAILLALGMLCSSRRTRCPGSRSRRGMPMMMG